jgi:2',3'-cyclic-nucleotide 2'-phosphodiesterase
VAMTEYQILFLGDVVGKSGRRAVQEWLPSLQDQYKPLFTIINGENSAGGVGITAEISREFFAWGADVITLGNHAFNKRDIGTYMASEPRLIRPNNMAVGVPGTGITRVEKAGIKLAVMNLCGRVSMDPQYNDPFAEIERADKVIETPHRFLDFHAEATSEKIAMGYHCEGRFSAVVGTHTHVQTADETVLEGGTAYITDVGMCGPSNSVLGMNRDVILRRFKTGLPEKFEVSDEPGVICGVVIGVESDTGRAVSIERIRRGPGT